MHKLFLSSFLSSLNCKYITSLFHSHIPYCVLVSVPGHILEWDLLQQEWAAHLGLNTYYFFSISCPKISIDVCVCFVLWSHTNYQFYWIKRNSSKYVYTPMV